MAELPGAYRKFVREYREIGEACDRLGEALGRWGPLEAKVRELVKLGIAVGAGLEGAVHSHTRRALEAGASPEEIRHAILLALTTVGFPSMMAALTWAEDLLGLRGKRKKE